MACERVRVDTGQPSHRGITHGKTSTETDAETAYGAGGFSGNSTAALNRIGHLRAAEDGVSLARELAADHRPWRLHKRKDAYVDTLKEKRNSAH